MNYGLLVRPRGLVETNSPYDWFKKMRKNGPVSFDPERNCWDVFCYEDVQMVLQNFRLFSSKRNGNVQTLLDMDPPTHRRYRNLVSQAFTPKTIQELEPRITAITHELLAPLLGKRKIDMVAEIAYPLPVIVISDMLGVSSHDRKMFKEWSDILVAGTQSASPNVMYKLFAKQEKAMLDLQTYFKRKISNRQINLTNNIISTLMTAEVGGDTLSMDELLSFCFLLLVAGNETTTNLIANTMLTLFEQPDILNQLYRDHSLIPAAIDEVLRYRSPFHGMNRFVTEDIQLKGMNLKKGQEVMAWIGSANRDERVFDKPDVFDINRSPNNYLSFGAGVHYCLGSQLAKLEAKICITEMLKAIPTMKLDTSKQLRLISSTFMYGYKELPVILGSE
ncbi:cytochrome P450 [Cytobacillus oceanisediminis]|uniref:cytochrome P450 n=1 Tax=Cytobacillus oceanisediminis TaxID=665099 RepID=UPI001C22AC02|nr:cytochrome P450 [Cytobacillus oceanisediminis]MBU8769389.1 cytochrome P450 [Cytobacillus oceanisediminis]MCM3392739.1 cytochrome P450 [Cytobacillus oceanisediminis]